MTVSPHYNVTLGCSWLTPSSWGERSTVQMLVRKLRKLLSPASV